MLHDNKTLSLSMPGERQEVERIRSMGDKRLRQSTQLKREEIRLLCCKYRKEFKSSADIAQILHDEHGIFNENTGQPYSPGWVTKLINETVKELAAEKKEHGKAVQYQIEEQLNELVETFGPLAREGNLRASEHVRKCLADLALLTGANEPVEAKVTHKFESSLAEFIPLLRQFMPEKSFDDLIAAIDKATAQVSDFYQNKPQLEDGSVIDAQVVED